VGLEAKTVENVFTQANITVYVHIFHISICIRQLLLKVKLVLHLACRFNSVLTMTKHSTSICEKISAWGLKGE